MLYHTNMFQSIVQFWVDNPKYWIPITEKDKLDADTVIFNTFYIDYGLIEIEPITIDDYIGKIIYLDQFQRHFQRHFIRTVSTKQITDDEIIAMRQEACELSTTILDIIDNKSIVLDSPRILFTLMPYKHTHQYQTIFQYIHSRHVPITDNQLRCFYMDTYKKAYGCDNTIQSKIISEYSFPEKNTTDTYPVNILDPECTWQCPNLNPDDLMGKSQLDSHLSNGPDNVIVSLSGGVDSMVMLTLLAKMSHKNVEAVHIVYGNRLESTDECQFISTYCQTLGVKLHIYSIEWLRRTTVSREFYEKMTREIRFAVYRCISSPDKHILLGHIRDDCIENIWTNVARCQHLDNLKKMEMTEIQMGVSLYRPLLDVDKSMIIDTAHRFGIPYFKNTTPEWSNRGKFRNTFYRASHEQFGKEVDSKLLCLADTLTKQSQMLFKLIHEPIYKSWNPETHTIDVSRAIESGLDAYGWSVIFEYVCHQFLRCSKPSIHAIREFMNRYTISLFIGTIHTKIRVVLKNNLEIEMIGHQDNKYTIRFILI
jgi:tRNA(Ile)-lysidine synthetase-like protein